MHYHSVLILPLFKVGINYQPMTTIEASRIGPSESSVVALHNSTLFKSPMHEVTSAVNILYAKKAFLHWYQAEGLEADEIQSALAGLQNLEADYDLVRQITETSDYMVALSNRAIYSFSSLRAAAASTRTVKKEKKRKKNSK